MKCMYYLLCRNINSMTGTIQCTVFTNQMLRNQLDFTVSDRVYIICRRYSDDGVKTVTCCLNMLNSRLKLNSSRLSIIHKYIGMQHTMHKYSKAKQDITYKMGIWHWRIVDTCTMPVFCQIDRNVLVRFVYGCVCFYIKYYVCIVYIHAQMRLANIKYLLLR